MGRGLRCGPSLDNAQVALGLPETPGAGSGSDERALSSLPEGPAEAHAATVRLAGRQPCAGQGTRVPSRRVPAPGSTRARPLGARPRGGREARDPARGKSRNPASGHLRSGRPPCRPKEGPLPSEIWKGGEGPGLRLCFWGSPLGDRSASPRTPFTAPGPCPVGKLWARGPAAGSAGQERLREPRGRCPFGKIIKADRSRSEKNRAGKRNSGENALPSRSPASPQEACQVPATGASTGLQPWAPGPGSSSRCPSGLGTSHGPGVAAHARRLPPRRRRADKSAK